MAYGILVPQQGIEPVPPALRMWSLNYWTPRKVQGAHVCLPSWDDFVRISFNPEQQPSVQQWKQPLKGRQNFHQHISVLSVGIRKLKHQAQSVLKTNLNFLEF